MWRYIILPGIGSCRQVSISPTFYELLLCVQIPKAHKNTFKLSVFFALLGFACIKAANKMLMKSTTEIVFNICRGQREARIEYTFYS